MYVRDYLRSRQVWHETLLHRPAPTASRHAESLHVSGQQVAKGVLVRSDGGYVLAVLPATRRIDLERLLQVIGGTSVRLATEEEVGRVFDDCERGALPPFGRLYGLRTIVEESLAEWPEFVCLGNLRHEGLRLRFPDYEALEAPTHARFATAPGNDRLPPDRPRPRPA
jgi:Ala-tRNA(Pro) deacylase